jgi:hypothetical protein
MTFLQRLARVERLLAKEERRAAEMAESQRLYGLIQELLGGSEAGARATDPDAGVPDPADRVGNPPGNGSPEEPDRVSPGAPSASSGLNPAPRGMPEEVALP